MKAFEAKKLSTASEYKYKLIMSYVKKAISKGKLRCFFDEYSPPYTTAFSPAVFEKLARNGFDCEVVLMPGGRIECIEISWQNAQKGRVGVITYKTPDIKIIKQGFFSRLFDCRGEDY